MTLTLTQWSGIYVCGDRFLTIWSGILMCGDRFLTIWSGIFMCGDLFFAFTMVKPHRTITKALMYNYKCEVRRPNFKFIFLYILCFLHFFIFLYFCTFVLLYFLYFCTFSFGWTVHMNFHAKSGVCSSKNDWVMSTFVLMYFFVLFLYFLYFCTFVIYLDYPYELPCKIWSL